MLVDKAIAQIPTFSFFLGVLGWAQAGWDGEMVVSLPIQPIPCAFGLMGGIVALVQFLALQSQVMIAGAAILVGVTTSCFSVVSSPEPSSGSALF
jgi:hypothetical protein